MDIKPLYKAGKAVAVEINMWDKTILVNIFTPVTENLEMAKFTLSRETQVIKIVDASDYTLKKG